MVRARLFSKAAALQSKVKAREWSTATHVALQSKPKLLSHRSKLPRLFGQSCRGSSVQAAALQSKLRLFSQSCGP
eukprot:1117411-Rhodomonas_salina.1